MENFQLPYTQVQYHDESVSQAAIAANHANQAYFYKIKYYRYESILRRWEELMFSAPLIMHTFLFMVFFFADIIVSWQMNRDIMASIRIFQGSPPSWAVLLLCLLINGWAAITGHFIGKGWSKDIQDWERWNISAIKYGGEITDEDVNNEVRREIWWARFYAILSGMILLSLVSMIIFHRIEILKQNAIIAKELGQAPVIFMPTIVKFLPIAILLGEFITGFYVIYIIQRYWQKWKRYINYRKFLGHKISCGNSDRLAHQYHTIVKEKGGAINMVADLEVSLHRFRTRSQEKDDYIDPVLLKRASFALVYKNNGRPVSSQFVYGALSNGAKTGHHRTNERGEVTVLWPGTFDKIELLYIPGYPTQTGPFYEHSEHIIELPDPTLVSSNGNGQHEPAETI